MERVAHNRHAFATLDAAGLISVRLLDSTENDGARAWTVPIETVEPGCHLAVSPSGASVVLARRSGLIEVWNAVDGVLRCVGRPSDAIARELEVPLAGEDPVEPMSLGPPRFVDESRFVTHHSGGLVVWRVDDARPVRAISDAKMTSVRDSWSLGDGALLVACETAFQPDTANALPFVVDIDTGAARERWPIVAAGAVDAAGGDGHVVVAGTRTLIVRTPTNETRYDVDNDVLCVAVDVAAGRIVWLEQGAVVAQTFDGAAAVRAPAPVCVAPASLYLVDGVARIIDAHCALHSVSLRDAPSVEPLPPTWHGAADALYHRAAIAFATGDGAGALLRTATRLDDRVAHVLYETIDGDGDASALVDRWRAADVDLGSPEASTALLRLATVLTDLEQTFAAGHAFVTWLRTDCQPHGIPTGLRIVDQLELIDDDAAWDARAVVVAALQRWFPDDARIAGLE